MNNIRICFFLFLLSVNISTKSQILRTELVRSWQFKQNKTQTWYPADVPGTVHTDLFANKLILKPFYGTNEKKLQWIENENWIYKTTFDLSDEVFSKKNIQLVFYGLDTYAEVWLNGYLILYADNMFRTWEIDCKQLLKKTDNELKITFYSVMKKNVPKYDSLDYELPAGNDRSQKKVSVFTRKAPYHFGWDWGPRFVTSGIWRPIEICAWNNLKINDLQIYQGIITKNLAEQNASIKILSDSKQLADIQLFVDDELFVKKRIKLQKGENIFEQKVEIKNPKLWWTNTLGDAYLYNFKIKIVKQNKIIAEDSVKFGIRKIEIVQEKDSIGESFYFKLNGIPIFIKGANYIPQDNFLPRVSSEKYKQIIQSAKAVNMNMLRVWGGGIYENDEFYNLCDENGILVWQDFMFSCSMYPGDSAFLKNVEIEAIENVQRLRNHPSIALWCGNNEMQVAWERWGYQKSFGYSKIDSAKIYDDYLKIFDDILPKVINKYDFERFYWQSSPNSAPSGWKEEAKTGDFHYWDVWWGKKPFSAYEKNVGRFMSEYGFQSIPALSTIKSFCDDSSLFLVSDIMKSHNKHPVGFETIREYMKRDFVIPDDFENYVIASQILQAEGMKTAIEAHRRAKPNCMGTLYWQLNDCWATVSWSSVDYFGRWKAFHYYLQKLYAPVLLSPVYENGKIKVYLVSDYLKDMHVNVKLRLMDFYGNVIWIFDEKAVMKANVSQLIFSEELKNIAKNHKKDEIFLNVEIRESDSLLSVNNLFFAEDKKLKLPKQKLSYKPVQDKNRFGIEISSTVFAKYMYLEYYDDKGIFSDNYFSLLSKEPKIVWFNTDISSEEIYKNVKIKFLNVFSAE